MKIILVLLDGLGDRAYKVLDNRTPLQAAITPHLDRLAQLGSNGLYHPALPGQCLPSELAHFLLFGYPREKFPGRALLEATGKGVSFEGSDVLFMAHLCHVEWRDEIPYLTVGRKGLEEDPWGLRDLYAAILPCEIDGVGFRLERTRPNDGILIASGPVSPWVSDSDPMVKDRALARIHPLSDNEEPEAAQRTASALNGFLSLCHRTLRDHAVNEGRRQRGLPSANFLVTLRPGRWVLQEPFEERWGLRGMLIASGAVFGGLARELGLAFEQISDSKDPAGDLGARIRLALQDTNHDFLHIHTKAADEAAHSGDPCAKRDVISALDRGFQGLVRSVENQEDLLVAVTSDHSTPSVSPLIHSGEPVPVALVGPGVRQDEVASFDEVSGAVGCLGFLRGGELLLTLLNHSNRSVLVGQHLGPAVRPYVPMDYEPFRLQD